MNTKLTDFPEDVLRAMLGAVIYKSCDTKDHLKAIKKHGECARVFEKEILEYETLIENLNTAEIQIATALAVIITDAKIRMN